MTQPEIRVVFVTAPDLEVARWLAETLVEEGLAACVNVVPGIESVYRRDGAVQRDHEVLMMIKTRTQLCDRLCARVEEIHPYQLPEVLALEVVGGSRGYLEWVAAGAGAEG